MERHSCSAIEKPRILRREMNVIPIKTQAAFFVETDRLITNSYGISSDHK
jgi:hypothetical protein